MRSSATRAPLSLCGRAEAAHAGRFRNVPIAHKRPRRGQSGYSLKKLLGLWLNGFTSFSVVPLRLATLAGALFACAGFVFALVTILRSWFSGPPLTPAGPASSA